MGSSVNSDLYQALRPYFLVRDEVGVKVLSSSVTKQVGTDKEFTTIQAAIDWFRGKILTASCYIDVDAGTYTENLTLSGIVCFNGAKLWIRGDTNQTSGYSCVIGSATRAVPGNRLALANLGTGNVTAAVGGGGTTLTITMSTTNPDFAAAGVNTAVRYYDAATGNNGTFTLTNVVGNVLTVGGGSTWPAGMANLGSAICFMPNRTLSGYINLLDGNWGLQGFTVSSAVSSLIYATASGSLDLYSCFIYGATSYGVLVSRNARIEKGYYNSIWECSSSAILCGSNTAERFGGGCDISYMALVDNGSIVVRVEGAVTVLARYCLVSGGTHCFYVFDSAAMFCQYAVAINASVIGFSLGRSAAMEASYAKALACAYGYYVEQSASMTASNATAQGCSSVGYYARTNGYLYAANTSANNNGNTANYSPSSSDTEGNIFGIITYS